MSNKKIQIPTTLRQAQCDNWNLEFYPETLGLEFIYLSTALLKLILLVPPIPS